MRSMREDTFEHGHTLLQNFVRGDAAIGLIADVPAVEREMMEALWSAAARGHARAYAALGDCYLAYLRPLGAFEGVAPDDADDRPWSAEAAAICDDDNPALQAALRAYHEAARLGERDALLQFSRISRHSTEETQRRGLSLLAALPDPSAAELYQRGLVQHWLGDLEASAKSHHEAAERGDLDAQFELSIYYSQGLGVAADPAAADTWLTRAADGGHPRALYNLGAAYASGARGEPDFTRAADYYRRAAEHGSGRAAAMLAVMILTGDIAGTPTEAGEWLDRAEDCNFETWELLDAVGVDDPREQDDD